MDVSSTAMGLDASMRVLARDQTPHASGWPIAMLRPLPKRAIGRSGDDLGRIVEEALAEYPVAAPFLQTHLVEPAHLAGFVGQFEIPVDGDVVALDDRRYRLGINVRHPRQDTALVGDQHVAADARRRQVLLHAGILGVIVLDRAGMVAGFDDRNELIETGSRWHQRPPPTFRAKAWFVIKCLDQEIPEPAA